jgi:hypothetical protein
VESVGESRFDGARRLIYKVGVSTEQTERAGVEAVRAIIAGDFGWAPREPERPDNGVDVYVELATDGGLTGRLFGMQIKSGVSYFRTEDANGFVFHGEPRHLRYWTRHSLPVILVLYNPETRVAYWTPVTEELVEPTDRGWKITVPRENVLGTDAKEVLARLADGDPYELAMRRLRSEITWMQHVAHGGRLILEADEWVNKSSGRGDVRLIAEANDGSVEKEAEWFIMAPWMDYAEALPRVFPWAELTLDIDTYDWADEEQWDLECGIWDSEDQRYAGHTFTFREWSERHVRDGLRPYEDDGEVAKWRLEVDLNSLGRAFVEVDEYLSSALADR